MSDVRSPLSSHVTRAEPLIIYDVGANKGENIPYFLLKAHKVVAIEANPALASLIRARHSQEIERGQLIVEECVVTANSGSTNVSDFYVHKHHDVLSQLPRPSNDVAHHFELITLPSRSIIDIISQHGHPFYVKIDIEHYDAHLLKALFDNDVRPAYISAEYHSIDVFLLLATLGGYKSFKLVAGASVSHVYKEKLVHNIHVDKLVPVSFPHHSAGPFGNDINGDWYAVDTFMKLLALEGMGWKDIHCSLIDSSVSNGDIDWRRYLDSSVTSFELFHYAARRAQASVQRKLLKALSWPASNLVGGRKNSVNSQSFIRVATSHLSTADVPSLKI